MKRCSKCDKDLPLEDFGPDKSSKDGLHIYCKKHAKEMNKVWYEKNKKHKNEQSRAWYEKNKEHANEVSRVWREKNKEYTRAYAKKNKERKKQIKKTWDEKNREHIREYEQTRYTTDIHFRLTCVLRSRLYKVVKNGQKTGSAVQDLGCTIEEFRVYVEKQFVEGMSWDNWGPDIWHLDHIKPLASFNLMDRKQFLQACHYTNIQPLWAEDNLSKGSNYDG